MAGRSVGIRSSRRKAWTGVLIVAAFAMLGGFIGLIAGVSMASGSTLSWGGLVGVITTSPSGDFAAILGGWGFVSAGAILGGYLGVLVLKLGHPGLICPRCGTTNPTTANACKACDLELRKTWS
jgi:hypothetical protein